MLPHIEVANPESGSPEIVELTWEILKKAREHREELTRDEELLVRMHEKECEERAAQADQANDDLKKCCKLVTSGMEKDLIPAYGWIQPIKKMAFELEALNILFKKHRVKIVFDQCKEKFADYCGYYSLDYADSKIVDFLMWPSRWLRDKLDTRHFDYDLVRKCFRKTHNEEIWSEEGNQLETKQVDNLVGYRPRKHKILFMVNKLNERFCLWLYRRLDFLNQQPKESEVIAEVLDEKAQEIVTRCERECRDHCIRCGGWIDKSRWCTRGWYTYICKDCASLEEGGLASVTNVTEQDKAKADIIFRHKLKKAIESSDLKGSFTQEALDSLDPEKMHRGRWKTASGVVVEQFSVEDDDDEDEE